MIRAEKVSKRFGAIQAVKEASFSTRPGTITIFTGADGAGKSTLFKILVGLVKRDEGKIFLAEQDIGDKSDLVTAICGFMPERFSLYLDLSIEENLNFFSDIHGVPRMQRENKKSELLEKTGLLPFRKRRAGTLSGGMKQKLSLCSILLASPKLIILDEPTTGVDPLSRIEFFSILQALKNEGHTILLSTPYLDEAEKGDSVVLMRGGRILFQDDLLHLKRTFPARLLRVTPDGNIFAIMESLQKEPRIRNDVYMRGNRIHYLLKGEPTLLHLIPALEVREEPPSLEDIYLYYERNRT